jgi:hypothetical protein
MFLAASQDAGEDAGIIWCASIRTYNMHMNS